MDTSCDTDGVWAVLGQDCNSTCRSDEWAKHVEAVFEPCGFDIPWVDNRTKTFSGLGGHRAQYNGGRRLPFAILFDDHCGEGERQEYSKGFTESWELEGSGPILTSLATQSSLPFHQRYGKRLIHREDFPGFACKMKNDFKSRLLVINIADFALMHN